jgi:hypothetical protein
MVRISATIDAAKLLKPDLDVALALHDGGDRVPGSLRGKANCAAPCRSSASRSGMLPSTLPSYPDIVAV